MLYKENADRKIKEIAGKSGARAEQELQLQILIKKSSQSLTFLKVKTSKIDPNYLYCITVSTSFSLS